MFHNFHTDRPTDGNQIKKDVTFRDTPYMLHLSSNMYCTSRVQCHPDSSLCHPERSEGSRGYIALEHQNSLSFQKPSSRSSYPSLIISPYNIGNVIAEHVHIFVEIPIEILAESNNHFIIEVKNGYAKIGLENIFRDIIGFDNLGNPIVGTPRVIPILPEITGPSRPIELKVGTSLDSREIKWKIFADTAPCKTGSIKLCDIEKMKKTNN